MAHSVNNASMSINGGSPIIIADMGVIATTDVDLGLPPRNHRTVAMGTLEVKCTGKLPIFKDKGELTITATPKQPPWRSRGLSKRLDRKDPTPVTIKMTNSQVKVTRKSKSRWEGTLTIQGERQHEHE